MKNKWAIAMAAAAVCAVIMSVCFVNKLKTTTTRQVQAYAEQENAATVTAETPAPADVPAENTAETSSSAETAAQPAPGITLDETVVDLNEEMDADAKAEEAAAEAAEADAAGTDTPEPAPETDAENEEEPAPGSEAASRIVTRTVGIDQSWAYAGLTKINSGSATLYLVMGPNAKNKTICVNAGHGTAGGSDVKVQCHPDGTPKVTGGTTEAGAVEAVAVSTGTTLLDGTPEAEVTLAVASELKIRLLSEGYNVLMIRETEDVQLDNIARTLLANHYADCHIAIHYDSTDFDKGVYYCGVPSSESYRSMEPVQSNWQQSEAFGQAIVNAFAQNGFGLFDNGRMEMDLTQTSYSEVPSIDLEVGDRGSDHSPETIGRIAAAITAGIDSYF